MAGKKTTKKVDEVLEEKNEALTNETTETVESTEETAAENTEVNEAPTDNGETPTGTENEEATEETTEEPTGNEAPWTLEQEGEMELKPETEDGNKLVDDETKELIGEVESVGKALEGDALTGPDAEQVISKELEHVDELEKKLKEKVNEGEKSVKTNNDRFTEFWCGVNNGWNN